MQVTGTGYTSYGKVQQFGQSQVIKCSVTLQAGKDKEGKYRKEYIDVQFSGQLSTQILASIQGDMNRFDGCKIEISGARLRCTPWQDRSGQKRKAIYVEVFEGRILEGPRNQFQNHGQNAGGYQQPQGMPQAQQGYQPQRQLQQQQQHQPYLPPNTGSHFQGGMTQNNGVAQGSHMAPPPNQPMAPQFQPNQGPVDLDNIPF